MTKENEKTKQNIEKYIKILIDKKYMKKVHKIYGFFSILWYNISTWFLGRMLNEIQRLL